jgi:peptidoglycan/LPS O-acetylase OafA/YrhL
MPQPWFDATYAWIPGTVLGCLCGLLGALAGVLAPRGAAKLPILAAWWTLLALGIGCLIAGGVAWTAGQPYAVWYGLGLAGLIVTIAMGCNSLVVVRRYREAELRKMQARDL